MTKRWKKQTEAGYFLFGEEGGGGEGDTNWSWVLIKTLWRCLVSTLIHSLQRHYGSGMQIINGL